MAAKQKRPKTVTYLSPPGAAVFPYLNEPDRGQYAKNKEFGNWKTGLRLDLSEPAVKKFLAQLETAYAESVTAAESAETPKEKAERGTKSLGATRPFKNEFDDAGNPTGFVIVNFKRSAGGRDKQDPSRTWVTPIGLFDSKNNKLDRSRVRIGGGSRIIVNYSIEPFRSPLPVGAGISLKLFGVQVLERMDAPEKDAAQYGFQVQDGGFVDDSEDAPESAASATTSAVGAAQPDDDDV